MDQSSAKSLQTTCTSLCSSIAKYSVEVPLTFNKVKNQTWNFQSCSSFFWFGFFFSVMHNSKTRQCVWILCILNNCFASGDHFYLFWAVCELWVARFGLKKLFPRSFAFSFKQSLASHIIIAGLACIVRPHLKYLLNTCVTGCDEFAIGTYCV